MSHDDMARVEEIVARFTSQEPSEFSDDDTIRDLRVVVRIALEVARYLERTDRLDAGRDLSWHCLTIISGLEPAWRLWQLYSDSERSVGAITIKFTRSFDVLRTSYDRHMGELASSDAPVEERLRALLKLVRLQLSLLSAGFGTVSSQS